MSFGKTNGDTDRLIQSMLQQAEGNDREGEKVKMIYTIVSAQILGPLLAAEYQVALIKCLEDGGDLNSNFSFGASRAYATAKQMAVQHMQQIGWGVGIKPKPKVEE